MADKTGIEWTDSTFNPWIGCTKVSPACDNCYAEATDARGIFGGSHWGAGVPRKRTSAANWRTPLQWNAKRFMECGECGWRGERDAELIGCGACGSSSSMNDARRRVFCASLADVFDNEVPEHWRWDLFKTILATPNLDWLLLTKRIGNARIMLNDAAAAATGDFVGAKSWDRKPWPNVWLGATVCNQAEADRDVPKLLAVPARVRFLSMEPLLGPVGLNYTRQRIQAQRSQLARAINGETWLDWVIVGGESGPKARPMSPQWARDLRDQCRAVGVPFLFKQWGEWVPMLGQVEGVPVRDHTTTLDGWVMGLAGKKAAGRQLDGVEHNGYPEMRS